MGTVVVDITMSLDGFITGPNDGPEYGLGEGGENLHAWVMGGEWTYETGTSFNATGVDKQVLDSAIASAGAGIAGRGMFDAAGGWGGKTPFGTPSFIVTHTVPEGYGPESGFTFVTDGIESALEQAQAVAGDKEVNIGGGADIIQQYLRAGLVDEMHIHLAPMVLGAGRPLFVDMGDTLKKLEIMNVLESPFATHIRYRIKQ